MRYLLRRGQETKTDSAARKQKEQHMTGKEHEQLGYPIEAVEKTRNPRRR